MCFLEATVVVLEMLDPDLDVSSLVLVDSGASSMVLAQFQTCVHVGLQFRVCLVVSLTIYPVTHRADVIRCLPVKRALRTQENAWCLYPREGSRSFAVSQRTSQRNMFR